MKRKISDGTPISTPPQFKNVIIPCGPPYIEALTVVIAPFFLSFVSELGMPAIYTSRAARDTCAPRAVIRRLINRNPLFTQHLQFYPARGARRSRDTSAALRLSRDFSYLSTSTCSSPPSTLKEPHELSGWDALRVCRRSVQDAPAPPCRFDINGCISGQIDIRDVRPVYPAAI